VATPTPLIDLAPHHGRADTRIMRLHPRAERLLIALFVVVLVLPALGTALGLHAIGASGENRTLAPFPRVATTWTAWRAFPDAFTRYFEDNFAFRPLLVRWQAMVRLKALDVSPSPSVVKGRDGWLFYADDGAMDDYALARPFTPAELDAWRRTLQDTRDWLEARGIVYLFVMAPDKHQVYPEQMPATIRRNAHSRMDQLAAYLAEHSTVSVLDLRSALRQGKPTERIYHRTDTHWNDRGAYIGYAQILTALSRQLPALHVRPRAVFDARRVTREGLDLARMLGVSDLLGEDDLTLQPQRPREAQLVEPRVLNPYGTEARVVTTLADSSQPRAVVFRDSFGTALIPFLSEHFSRAVYLWQYNVDPDVIARERPQVVIQELAGRRLTTLTPYNPFERRAEPVLTAAAPAPTTVRP
jgi:alginate O-acetyltransferase complex protein AlgJ